MGRLARHRRQGQPKKPSRVSAAPTGLLAGRGGSIAVYVVMKVSVSWCTTAGLGVATWLPSGQVFARSPAAEA